MNRNGGVWFLAAIVVFWSCCPRSRFRTASLHRREKTASAKGTIVPWWYLVWGMIGDYGDVGVSRRFSCVRWPSTRASVQS